MTILQMTLMNVRVRKINCSLKQYFDIFGRRTVNYFFSLVAAITYGVLNVGIFFYIKHVGKTHTVYVTYTVTKSDLKFAFFGGLFLIHLKQ